MKTQLIQSSWETVECDALIIPVFEDEDMSASFASKLNKVLSGLLQEFKNTKEWKAKPGKTVVIYRPKQLKAAQLILLGAGKNESCDSYSIRKLTMQAVGKIKGCNLKKIAIVDRCHIQSTLAAQAIVEGAILSTYNGDEYKTEEKPNNFIEEILFVTDAHVEVSQIETALERGEILAEATNLARSLVNEPANCFSPSQLAEFAKKTGEQCHLEVDILGESEMEAKGMAAILAVSQGSEEPARFIILKHSGHPNPKTAPIVLVGKGVTFDSGGLSLKPAQSMEEMKCDKAGACAVLASMQAISKLQIPKNVVGLIPAVENMPSGSAQRPGDVIRSMSGKTIEVINTDAEGRLILADALHFGRQIDAEYMVDVATLTGACVVALGNLRAGLFSNNDELCEKLLQAGERAGEKFWRLPLDEEYREEIKTQIADIKNVGGRWGGAITAAKFLQEFVGDVPWCHIDIAGVDLFQKGQSVQGPTGFSVRTLVEMVDS